MPYVWCLFFCMGNAEVIPLLKAEYPIHFKDLRSIYNLISTSNIFENCMGQQIWKYQNEYNVLPDVKLGFRPLRNCTTMLLKMIGDSILEKDSETITALV